MREPVAHRVGGVAGEDACRDAESTDWTAKPERLRE
jgi:hypothetical protein